MSTENFPQGKTAQPPDAPAGDQSTPGVQARAPLRALDLFRAGFNTVEIARALSIRFGEVVTEAQAAEILDYQRAADVCEGEEARARRAEHARRIARSIAVMSVATAIIAKPAAKPAPKLGFTGREKVAGT